MPIKGWRDIDNIDSRFAGRQKILDDLFTAVRLSRPTDASEIPVDTPALQRRNPKKKTTIKQLFSAASKFQKNLRRLVHHLLLLLIFLFKSTLKWEIYAAAFFEIIILIINRFKFIDPFFVPVQHSKHSTEAFTCLVFYTMKTKF